MLRAGGTARCRRRRRPRSPSRTRTWPSGRSADLAVSALAPVSASPARGEQPADVPACLASGSPTEARPARALHGDCGGTLGERAVPRVGLDVVVVQVLARPASSRPLGRAAAIAGRVPAAAAPGAARRSRGRGACPGGPPQAGRPGASSAPGDLVPADGRVIGGEGVVDEQSVRGNGGCVAGATGRLVARRLDRPGGLAQPGGRATGGPDEGVGGSAGPCSPRRAPRPVRRPRRRAPRRSPSEPSGRRSPWPAWACWPATSTTAAAILRPDYATGPGVAVPLETVRDATACARLGIVVRSPDAFDRLARVDTIVLDDAPALRACGLEIVEIQSRLPEPVLLRYAASAFRHMADERAEALIEACCSRRCHILDLPAVEFEPGVTVVHGAHRVRVRDLDPDPRRVRPAGRRDRRQPGRRGRSSGDRRV